MTLKNQVSADCLSGQPGRRPGRTALCVAALLQPGRRRCSPAAVLPFFRGPWICPIDLRRSGSGHSAPGATSNLIGREFDLIIDFMVNHISRQSVYFQDYFEKGPDSEFADMFLSFNKLSPTGEISEADLAKVYTRKPRPPYTTLSSAPTAPRRRSGAPSTMNRSIWTGIHPKPVR
jgi:hypothetical protein